MSAPNSPKTKRRANGKFLPKPLLFHLRHPNSKTNQPKVWQILSPKNSFAKRNFTPAKSEMQGVFFFRGCRGSARQWRNDTSVRGSFKPPHAPRVRLVGIRVAFKIHSNFVQ